MRKISAALVCLGFALSVPRPAEAVSGFYLELGGGIGVQSGDDLILYERRGPDGEPLAGDLPIFDPDDCCGGTGGVGDLRIGYSIGGYVAPEFGLVGNIFDTGAEFGGAGYIGGGARVFFMKLLSLTGLPTDSWPIELSMGTMFGYTIVGRDFAYEGWFVAFDPKLDVKVTKFMNIGFKTGIFLPNYDAFQYVGFATSTGRCLNASGRLDFNDANANGVADPGEVAPAIPRDAAACSDAGAGPDAAFFSPSLTITFHFDPFGG